MSEKYQDEASKESLIIEFYDRFSASVHRTISRIIRDEAAAEDLTAETLTRAIKFAHTLKDVENVSGWINRIAYNVAVDHLRRMRRTESELESNVPPWNEQAASDVGEESPESERGETHPEDDRGWRQVDPSEIMRRLQRGTRLSQKTFQTADKESEQLLYEIDEQQMLKLWQEGKSLGNIALITGVGVSTVARTLKRLQKEIVRQHLEEIDAIVVRMRRAREETEQLKTETRSNISELHRMIAA